MSYRHDEISIKAAALDEIVKTLHTYLPPDSGITPAQALTIIIGIIKTHGLAEFIDVGQHDKR